ncbi:MAG: hypothetical protein M3004_01165, partial [Bacteroidota bacterium]|nr:hypothetical protein [Bacteroidota bacterium]
MKLGFIILLSFCCLFTCAQIDGVAIQKEYQIHITKTNEPIKIDGELNEPIWKSLGSTSPFWKKFPDDKGRPKRNTEVRITYDDKFLYISFVAYDSGKAFTQTLKRDFGHDANDCVAVILD